MQGIYDTTNSFFIPLKGKKRLKPIKVDAIGKDLKMETLDKSEYYAPIKGKNETTLLESEVKNKDVYEFLKKVMDDKFERFTGDNRIEAARLILEHFNDENI